MAKHSVDAVQVRGGLGQDEELGAVGVWALGGGGVSRRWSAGGQQEQQEDGW